MNHTHKQETEHKTRRIALADPTTGFEHACPACGLYFADARGVKTHRAFALGEVTPEAPQRMHCLHKFHSWHYLGKHLRRNVCRHRTDAPNLLPTQPAEAATTQGVNEAQVTAAVVRSPDTLRTLKLPNGWIRLANTQKVRQELAQVCCLRGQWCTNAGGIKRHIASRHADVYKSCHQAAPLH